MTFKEDVEEDEDQLKGDNDVNLIDYIALLAKRFGKVMGILDGRSGNNVKNNVKDNMPLF